MAGIRPADLEREHEGPNPTSIEARAGITGWAEFDDDEWWVDFPRGSRHVYRHLGGEWTVEVIRRRRNTAAGTFKVWFRKVEQVAN